MKNRLLVGLIFALPVGLLLFFLWRPETIKTSPPTPAPADQQAAIAQALAAQSPRTVAAIHSNFARLEAPPPASPPPATRPAARPAPLEFTNFAPATVVQNMSRAVRQFGEMFGGNPVGTNPEITRQLTGQNPKRLNFISADAGLRINGNGELVDPWGTPFFFHQISGHQMEIHSAGPDQVMWTADDLVSQ